MSQTESTGGPGVAWVPLSPRERRVVGVLAEKGKTTPEYYPLTVAAIVAGCNQKSNRDPITNYDQDDVEDALQSLRKKGASIMVEAGGRVPRWKHTLYEWLKVSKAELAVLIELLLRGPQTEGELRARVSRMESLADLAALQTILEALMPRGLVVYLSPPGQKRGVMLTHGLYPPEELEKVRLAFAATLAAGGDEEAPARVSAARGELSAGALTPAWATEIAAVRGEVDELRNRLETLAADCANSSLRSESDRMSMPSLGPQDVEPPLTPPPTPETESATADQPDQPVGSRGDDSRGGIGEVESSGQALQPQPDLVNEPEPQAPRSGWRLVALIPHDGKEPPAGLDDVLAQATWCAASALWHPSLLGRAAELPIIEPIETPSAPAPKEIRVIASGTLDRLPSGYRTQVEDAGAILLESGTDRAALIGQIQERLGAVGTPETSD